MKFGLVMTIANVVTFFKVSDALFFGFNIQDPAGNTIAGANANQTGALFGIGFLLASLGLLKKNNNRQSKNSESLLDPLRNASISGTFHHTRAEWGRPTLSSFFLQMIDHQSLFTEMLSVFKN